MKTNGRTFADIAAEPCEWEYEYDDNETEEVYFTLDLSAHQIPTVPPGRTSSKAKAKAPAARASSNTAPNTPSAAASAGTPASQPDKKEAVVSSDGSAGKLQILDLDSDNPLILYNNALYSCQWSTPLGSQFYIARHGAVPRSLRSGYVLDVVGISSAKLVGRAATLNPIMKPPASESSGLANGKTETSDCQMEGDVHAETQDPETVKQRLATLRLSSNDPEVKANASFLERLSAIKQQRGENDTVPIHAVQNYQVSDAVKERIRKQAQAEKEVTKAVDKSTSAKTPVVRGPRGPYKKRAPETMNELDTQSSKRKKPGPKSGMEVRAALGLGRDVATKPAFRSSAPMPMPWQALPMPSQPQAPTVLAKSETAILTTAGTTPMNPKPLRHTPLLPKGQTVKGSGALKSTARDPPG